MNQTIQGTYKNGTILLDRLPEGVAEARVVVEFVEQPSPAPERVSRRRGVASFGMFAPSNGHFTNDHELQETKKSWNAKLDTLGS
jgi:hypothetical protein